MGGQARLVSEVGPVLESGENYWLWLSVSAPNSRYQWFVGAAETMAGFAQAEKYDFAVGDWPANTWIGSDFSNGSGGLHVVATPVSW